MSTRRITACALGTLGMVASLLFVSTLGAGVAQASTVNPDALVKVQIGVPGIQLTSSSETGAEVLVKAYTPQDGLVASTTQLCVTSSSQTGFFSTSLGRAASGSPCTSPTGVSGTYVTIDAGERYGILYYGDSYYGGSYNDSGSLNDITPTITVWWEDGAKNPPTNAKVSRVATVYQQTPTQLTFFTAPFSMMASNTPGATPQSGQCNADGQLFTVGLQSDGQPVPASTDTEVSIFANPGTVMSRIATSAGGPISQVPDDGYQLTIPAGSSSVSAYIAQHRAFSGFNIRASVTGMNPVVQTESVTGGCPTKLVFSSQPRAVEVSDPATNTYYYGSAVVELTDAWGNAANSDPGMAITITSNTQDVDLGTSSPCSNQAVLGDDGVADFDALCFTHTGHTNQLIATSSDSQIAQANSSGVFVYDPPTFTSSDNVSATANEAMTPFEIETTGGSPVPDITVTGLPPGLTYTEDTKTQVGVVKLIGDATISGTPTTPGTYTVTAKAVLDTSIVVETADGTFPTPTPITGTPKVEQEITFVISPGPPGVPTAVTASAGDGSATLSWTPPSSDGGSPITGYVVTPSPACASCDITVSGTSASVTGLSGGTSYTFGVAATNENGTGASASSNSVRPNGLPAAPTALTASAGEGSATLSWSPPSSDGGSPITGYTVTPSPACEACQITQSVSSIATGLGDAQEAGVAVDSAGDVYVSDFDTNSVLEITPSGSASTFASGFDEPTGLAFDSAGNLYVTNPGNGTVSEVTPSGLVSTVASGLGAPFAVAVDASGDIYTSDSETHTVTETTPSGTQSTVLSGYNAAGMAVDGAGDLYVVTNKTGELLEVTPQGTVTTLATGLGYTLGLAMDAGGNLYVSLYGGTITEITPAGSQSTYATGVPLLFGLAIDGSGNLYASDGNTVAEVSATSATVSGLTSGTPYSFTVMASNANGPGAASDPSNTVTPS